MSAIDVIIGVAALELTGGYNEEYREKYNMLKWHIEMIYENDLLNILQIIKYKIIILL